MNTVTLLLTPWRSSRRSMRWLASIVLVLCTGFAVSIGVFSSDKDWLLGSTYLLCFGLVYFWAFFLSNTLLLAVDARTLRMPGMEHRIVRSLVLYAVLGIVPATVVLAAFGGHALNIGTLLSLSCVAGLGFAILPRYLAMFMALFPAFTAGLRGVLDIPGVDAPQFVYWALPATLVLLAAVIVRWRRLVRAENPLEQGLSSAMVMQWRRSCGLGTWDVLGSADMSRRIRNRPDWMQARANLRRAGPRWPVNTLRIALGGWYLPRTFGGYLRALAPVLLPLLIFIPVLMLMKAAKGEPMAFWSGFGVGMVGWIGIFGAAMLALIGVTTLRKRWVRTNAELPLLALLPGLGGSERVKRELLRACLGMPLVGLGLLLVVDLGAGLKLHLHGLGLFSVAMAQVGSAAALIALMLDVLGGRPVHGWVLGVLVTALFILVSLSSFMPLTALGSHPWVYERRVVLTVMGAWPVFGVVLLWLGRRGWSGLMQRPHAFLANPG